MTAANRRIPQKTAGFAPSFFDPRNAASWDYRSNLPQVFNEALDMRATVGRALTKKKVHPLIIDAQKDFTLPQGTLYVAGRSGTGAIDDTRRTAEWIYNNIGFISDISCTLDTHIPYQIFSRSFWEKEDGSPIDAFTEITAEMLKKGVYKPSLAAVRVVGGNYNWLLKQCIFYCEELERAGKYKLYIWPEHCLLGSAGHGLVGLVEEAVYFHSYARGSQIDFQIKGGNPMTENYSVMSPEVTMRHDGASIPGAQKNVRLMETLVKADIIPIFGQASSHCVQSSIDDFLSWILSRDPELAKKVYVVEDCMSAVTVANPAGGFYADFTPQSEAALKKFSDAGMHVVKSTDPLESWPDVDL